MVLAVVACVKPPGAGPRRPSFRSDESVDIRLHDYGSGVFLPWAAEVCRKRGFDGEEIRLRRDLAVLEDYCSDTTAVFSALSGDHAALVVHWFTDHHFTVLEHSGGISEDKIDGAGDHAVTIELAVGVCVECVLVCVDVAIVEDRVIAGNSERYRLVLVWPSRVLESNVLGYETIGIYGCSISNTAKSHY